MAVRPRCPGRAAPSRRPEAGPSAPNETGMGRSTLGPTVSRGDIRVMAHHLKLVSSVDVDLTDENGLPVESHAEFNVDGVRNLLAALNLKAPGGSLGEPDGIVIDMSIYRATGNAHLATIFSAAS